MRTRALFVPLVFLAAACAQAAVQKEPPGVRATIDKYIQGARDYQEAPLAEAFHPSGHLKCIVEMNKKELVLTYAASEWVKLWGAKQRAEGEKFSSRIVSIEPINEKVAQAKVEMTFDVPGKGATSFTDALTLIETGGRWSIINKVCTSRTTH